MRLTILGSGASSGVPMVGLGWGACDPANPKNTRLRPSILVEEGGTRLLVDTSPDLRQQLLRADITELDAVLYTHEHADHLHGIDDLRGINRTMARALPCWGDATVLAAIHQRFGYVLKPLPPGVEFFYKPTLAPNEIDGPFTIGPMTIIPFQQDHGYCATTGFRFGQLAYSTDVVNLDEHAFAILGGIDVWILGCLGYDPHDTHAHLDKCLEWIRRVRPRRVVLTHLSYHLDYDTLRKILPPHVEPAYDGMIIEC